MVIFIVIINISLYGNELIPTFEKIVDTRDSPENIVQRLNVS
jgi:hypothetical protein